MKYKQLLQNKKLLEKEVPKEILEKLGIKSKKPFECDQIYFYIDSSGKIAMHYWFNDDVDFYLLKHNNAFHTKKEAEFEFEKREVLAELREFAENNNTEDIDYEDYKKEKWFIYYDFKDKEIYYNSHCFSKSINEIYFTSGEIAIQAVKEIGEDRIKKYVFERGEKDE